MTYKYEITLVDYSSFVLAHAPPTLSAYYLTSYLIFKPLFQANFASQIRCLYKIYRSEYIFCIHFPRKISINTRGSTFTFYVFLLMERLLLFTRTATKVVIIGKWVKDVSVRKTSRAAGVARLRISSYRTS